MFSIFLFTSTTASTSNDQHQSYFSINQITPSNDRSCNINWLLDAGIGQIWQRSIFKEVMKVLTQSRCTTSIFTKVNNDFSNLTLDFKGTCSLNWFMATNFNKLTTALKKTSQFTEYRNDDWFVFINVSFN